jgi:hypothetical protein
LVLAGAELGQDLDNLISVLAEKDIDDIDNHEYYNQPYWNDCIHGATPPVATHAKNVRAVLMLCLSDQTLKAHLTEKVIQWFKAFLKTKCSKGHGCTSHPMMFQNTSVLARML